MPGCPAIVCQSKATETEVEPTLAPRCRDGVLRGGPAPARRVAVGGSGLGAPWEPCRGHWTAEPGAWRSALEPGTRLRGASAWSRAERRGGTWPAMKTREAAARAPRGRP